MAVETRREADAQSGDNRTMGRKTYIPYGLYRTHGFISAPLAEQTGFSEEDLELFWEALINMFDHDRSAARGEMAAQKLIVFKHDDELGNAPAHKLFDLASIDKKDKDAPARTFSDYSVYIDKSAVPSGVELTERL
jgi:CRISPR-associated protein Csd2